MSPLRLSVLSIVAGVVVFYACVGVALGTLSLVVDVVDAYIAHHSSAAR